jgi:hypothetical protein
MNRDCWTLILSWIDFNATGYSHIAALTVSKQWLYILSGGMSTREQTSIPTGMHSRFHYEPTPAAASRYGLSAIIDMPTSGWSRTLTTVKVREDALPVIAPLLDITAWVALLAGQQLDAACIDTCAEHIHWPTLLISQPVPEWILAHHLRRMQRYIHLVALQDISAAFIAAHVAELDLVAIHLRGLAVPEGFWDRHLMSAAAADTIRMAWNTDSVLTKIELIRVYELMQSHSEDDYQ